MNDDEKYHVVCTNCRNRYQLGTANTVLYLYKKRSYACWVESMCHCGEEDRNFIDPEEAKVMLDRGFPHFIEDDCQPWVIEEWQRINEVELLETVELTPRHEELIESLRVVLDKTPDHHLMDIFSSPPPKSKLPRRWL